MNPQLRGELVAKLLSDVHAYELPLREAEHIPFSFELVMDQGAYYEFKRHRMMTLSPQALTAELGYCIPVLIEKAGCLDLYRNVMDEAQQTWRDIYTKHPEAAAYCVPNGFNRRMLSTINLRSLYHLVRLRTRPSAHFSIRRVACRMAESVSQVCLGLVNTFPYQIMKPGKVLRETIFARLDKIAPYILTNSLNNL